MRIKTVTPLGVEPTQDEIAEAIAEIAAISPERRFQFASALGSLRFVIEDMAKNHNGCAEPKCPVCWDLRQARAVFIALNKTQHYGTRPMFGGAL